MKKRSLNMLQEPNILVKLRMEKGGEEEFIIMQMEAIMKVNGKTTKCMEKEVFIIQKEALPIKEVGTWILFMAKDAFTMILLSL